MLFDTTSSENLSLTIADGSVKIPLGTIAKVIGERWRNLSDDEKEKYKAQAQAKVLPPPLLLHPPKSCRLNFKPLLSHEAE